MAKITSKTKSKSAAKKAALKTKKVVKNTNNNKKPTNQLVNNLPAQKTPAKKNGKNQAQKNSKVTKNGRTGSVQKPTTKLIVQKKTKIKKVVAGPKGYTSDQYEKFLAQKKRLQSFSNQQLKDLLRKNLQSMSGNKDELVQKAADGIVLGRIPKCPTCFGGRPKFNYKVGTYHCSGYRDDQQFKNCHITFQLVDIKRDPWE